ncbi:hypothetical protein [Microbacterium sp. AR7-10]|uniref:hypothetical protein n=1 Tax=Microbacterium sp. AR7-10 TaxID=1891970 RepID=UPI000A9F0822|nr:hypothetical protein [Microbacterium sp. AR7-10]
MTEHVYLESGWCSCGHHRDDGRRDDRSTPYLPTRAEIRAILGPTYQPKERT